MEPLSVSQVQTYLGCALQYRFRYVDKIPSPWRPAALAFGSSVHAAAEWFHRERIEGRLPSPNDVVRIFEADWYAQTLEPLTFPEKETKESLTDKGRILVRLLVEETSPALPQLVEERFEIDLVDPETGEVLETRLRGVIDLVEADGTLVELKTAARAYDTGTLERHLQVSTYALVLFLKDGAIPKLRIDTLLKTKVPRLEHYELTRSLADLAWTARLLEGVGHAIAARQFHPNPSWRCCECEYFAHCQAWRGP